LGWLWLLEEDGADDGVLRVGELLLLLLLLLLPGELMPLLLLLLLLLWPPRRSPPKSCASKGRELACWGVVGGDVAEDAAVDSLQPSLSRGTISLAGSVGD